MAGNALYYPYIHIRDINWLKATLLLFPQVRRMIPYGDYVPDDPPEIREFATISIRRKPLLTRADLKRPRVVKAQIALAAKLRNDAGDRSFRRRYDRKAAAPELAKDPLGFQIHARKLEPELTDTLRDSGLAWDPQDREPYDVGGDYLQVHHRVGEAVMSTLAVNCALADGLNIVGDTRSERLHRCLIEKDAESIYSTWLGQASASEPPPLAATGEELFEFLIGFACNLNALGPEVLASMGSDREALERFIERLRASTAGIPKMDPGPEPYAVV